MTTDKMWAIVHDDGQFEQVFASAKPKIPKAKVYSLERFGDLANEKYDPKTGWTTATVEKRKRAIDSAHDIDHPGLRLVNYAIKQIEARIILGTLTTDGLLAREAVLRGIDVIDLAKSVLIKAEESEVELNRITKVLDLENKEK